MKKAAAQKFVRSVTVKERTNNNHFSTYNLTKKIEINFSPKDYTFNRKLCIQMFLHILLHELRHAEHHKKGLFKRYYSKDCVKYNDYRALGMRAEIDCDKTAFDFIKANYKELLIEEPSYKKEWLG